MLSLIYPEIAFEDLITAAERKSEAQMTQERKEPNKALLKAIPNERA